MIQHSNVIGNVSTTITFDKINPNTPTYAYGVGPFNASLAAIWHPMADLFYSTNFMYFLADGARVIDITAPSARAECNSKPESCKLSYYVSGGIADFAPSLIANGDAKA